MNDVDKILRKNSLILTVCNFAQVRSQCMATTMRKFGFENVHAFGALTQLPETVDKIFNNASLLIICNWKNVEDKFIKDQYPLKEELVTLYQKYRFKSIQCDQIEYDRWGNKDHPVLIEICENFVKTL